MSGYHPSFLIVLQFYNEATDGMTTAQVNTLFAKLASTTCGVDPATYLSVLANNYTVSDEPVRIGFKYASSRAVTVRFARILVFCQLLTRCPPLSTLHFYAHVPI